MQRPPPTVRPLPGFRLTDPRVVLVGHRIALVVALLAGAAWALTAGSDHFALGSWESADFESAAMATSREVLRGGGITREALVRTGPLAVLVGATSPFTDHDGSRRAILIVSTAAAALATGFAIRLTFSAGAALLAFTLVFVGVLLNQPSAVLSGPLGALLVAAVAWLLPAGGHLSFPRAVLAGFVLAAALFQDPELGWPLIAATILTALATLRRGISVVLALASAAVLPALGLLASARGGGLPGRWLAVAAGVIGLAIVARAGSGAPARFLGGSQWAWCLAICGAALASGVGVGVALGLPLTELWIEDLRRVVAPLSGPWREVAPSLVFSAGGAVIAACLAVYPPWNRSGSQYVSLRARRRAGAAAVLAAKFGALARWQFGLRACLLAAGSFWVAWCGVHGQDIPLVLVPWSWLLIATEPLPDRAPSLRSLRLWLAFAYAFSLLALPAANPRAGIAMLAALFATIGLHDSWQRLRALATEVAPHRATRPALRGLGALLLALGLFAATAGSLAERSARAERQATLNLEPLGLPGARTVRAPLDTVRALTALVATLDARCDSYVVLPPWDAITFWTHPTGPQALHASPHGLESSVQDRVLARLKGSARPCWVRHERSDVEGKSWEDYRTTTLGRGASEWMPRAERLGEFVLLQR